MSIEVSPPKLKNESRTQPVRNQAELGFQRDKQKLDFQKANSVTVVWLIRYIIVLAGFIFPYFFFVVLDNNQKIEVMSELGKFLAGVVIGIGGVFAKFYYDDNE